MFKLTVQMGGEHSNKLLVQLNEDCPTYGYLSNEDPAYNSTLSMLLAAKMSKEKIRVVVDDSPQISDAAKIQWVNFK